MSAPNASRVNKQTFDAVQQEGGIRPAARKLGLHHKTIMRRLAKYEEELAAKGEEMPTVPHASRARHDLAAENEQLIVGDLTNCNATAEEPKPIFQGKAEPDEWEHFDLPPEGEVYNYILTSAQNNTHVDMRVWRNLEALGEYYKAPILVSRFTYNPNNHGSLAVKPASGDHPFENWMPSAGPGMKIAKGGNKKIRILAYDKVLSGHECDRQVVLAPGLVWCGQSNTIPTNQNPLAGLESHTGRLSAIYPHPRLAMRSVASGKFEATKLMYTTGCVTQLNYIQKLAGQKAEHHHTLGALIVQVNSKGHWYVRQLNADRTGAIFDADVYAYQGKVRKHAGVEAVVFGDLHAARAEAAAVKLAQKFMDEVGPDKIILHDVLDFNSRSHHGMKDPFEMFAKHVNGQESVSEELTITATMIRENFMRRTSQTVIVNSNHDRHLERWIKEADWKRDPANALCYLDLAKAQLEAIAANDNDFMLAEHALQQHGLPKAAKMLRVDESFVLLKDRSGGIEVGYHGDTGAGGARGNIRGFARMGRKTIIGHSHSAGIEGGCYQCGTLSQLDLGYNSGPGSWTWSHVLVHANGKRQMITFYDSAWRAEGVFAEPTIRRAA